MQPPEQLKLFLERVEELRHCKLLQDFNIKMSVKWNEIDGLSFTSKYPNEEYLRSYLLIFRQFILNNEPVFIHKIYNLCQCYLIDEQFKTYLKKSREIWEKSKKNLGIQIEYKAKGIFGKESEEITPELATDLFINGYYFHSDLKKRKILQSIMPLDEVLLRFQFLSFIQEGTKQVLYMGNIIKIGFEKVLFRF